MNDAFLRRKHTIRLLALSPETKIEQSRAIAASLATFIANGGSITKVALGVTVTGHEKLVKEARGGAVKRYRSKTYQRRLARERERGEDVDGAV